MTDPADRERDADAPRSVDEIARLLVEESKAPCFHNEHRLMLYALADAVIKRGEEIKRLRAALERIACWSDGSKVTGSFDEPASAREARAALRGQAGSDEA